MKTTINLYAFREAFRTMGRSDFTDDGLNVLFSHLESIEDETGEEIDLDVIALCCEFAEDPMEEVADHYNIDLTECEDDDEKEETVLAFLNDNTSVCGVAEDGRIVYQQF